MVWVAESYTGLNPEKSLQQMHFPVSALHSPPVLLHLGSHGEGRGGFSVQLGFLNKEKNWLFYKAVKIWGCQLSNLLLYVIQSDIREKLIKMKIVISLGQAYMH